MVVGLVWKLFCSLGSRSVIFGYVICDGGKALRGPAHLHVYLCKAKPEVFFKGKLLQPVVTFKAKNKIQNIKDGNNQKPLGRTHTIKSSVGQRPPFVLGNRDLKFGRQERWSNLQFVVVTDREQWPVCLCWARFLSCLGMGTGTGSGEKGVGASSSK